MWHELMLKVDTRLWHQVNCLNLCQFLNQWEAKPNLIAPSMCNFFRALSQLQGIARNSGSRYSCDVTAATGVSIKFEMGSQFEKSRRRYWQRAARSLLLGGSGGMPPRKMWNREALKHYFQRSKHQIVYRYKYDFLAPTWFFCLFLQSYWYVW